MIDCTVHQISSMNSTVFCGHRVIEIETKKEK